MMVRDQWVNMARMPGLHPNSFLGGFLMTTESNKHQGPYAQNILRLKVAPKSVGI